jgi:hypothetical protein
MQSSKATAHSITLSARASRAGGTARPSPLAVWSDAFNFPEPLAQLASAVQLSDPLITGCDPAIELYQFGLGLK